jgi:hypothetical protein
MRISEHMLAWAIMIGQVDPFIDYRNFRLRRMIGRTFTSLCSYQPCNLTSPPGCQVSNRIFHRPLIRHNWQFQVIISNRG